MKKKVPRTLHYKQVELSNVARGITLQTLLASVFKIQLKPIGRVQDIISGPRSIDGANDLVERVVVALKFTHKGMLCGLLQRFEPGASVPATIMNEDAENWQIRGYKPPVDSKGKESAEFLKNHMYFGVRGNHVILTQESGFGAQQLQMHCQWLCERFLDGFEKRRTVLLLQDHIPTGYERDFSRVRNVKIETQPQMKPVFKKGEKEPLSWTIERDPLIDAFFEVMRKARKNPLGREPSELDQAYKDGSLKATITLSYAGGKESPLCPVAVDLLNTTGLKWKNGIAEKGTFNERANQACAQLFGGVDEWNRFARIGR